MAQAAPTSAPSAMFDFHGMVFCRDLVLHHLRVVWHLRDTVPPFDS